jgi:hypothetical protein
MTSGILFSEPERDQTVSAPLMCATADAAPKSDLNKSLHAALTAQRSSASTSAGYRALANVMRQSRQSIWQLVSICRCITSSAWKPRSPSMRLKKPR